MKIIIKSRGILTTHVKAHSMHEKPRSLHGKAHHRGDSNLVTLHEKAHNKRYLTQITTISCGFKLTTGKIHVFIGKRG